MHVSRHHRKPEEYSKIIASKPASSSIFGGFILRPKAIRFDTQLKEEEILLFLRQHPVVLLPAIVGFIFMLVVPLVFSSFVAPFVSIPWNYQLVLTLFWYLFTFGVGYEQLLLYFFNSFVITDERMIDIDFHNLIYKKTNYAQLDKIQDVTNSTKGVLFSLLDVGTVYVQTAAEIPEFVFENIPHPNQVVQLLNELVIEEQREQLEGRVR